MVNPIGDPTTEAGQKQGDSTNNYTGNEFTFDNSAAGILTIRCQAEISPNNPTTQAWAEQNVEWTVPDIGTSTKTWVNADGTAADNKGLVVYCRFTNLPANNNDFGLKEVKMMALGVDTKRNIEVFYTATATNHPPIPGTTTPKPNWFYYYLQNVGADAGGNAAGNTAQGFAYQAAGPNIRSRYSRSAGGLIIISDEAYLGDYYLNTTIIQTAGGRDQLRFVDESAIHKYYANFIGILAHERGHADDEVANADGTPADPGDEDYLSEGFELNTSKTDPAEKYSARGDLTGTNILNGASLTDNEVYFGGPVEKAAFEGADTANDWAFPGTNSASAN